MVRIICISLLAVFTSLNVTSIAQEATPSATLLESKNETTAPSDRPNQEKDENGDRTTSAKLTVPVFVLKGAITESPQGEDPFFGNVGTESLKDLVKRLETARDDDNVPAVVLLVEGDMLGRAQAEEVRAVLRQIQESGKPVYGHSDQLSFGRYYLMSACSRLSVVPTGDVMILGMYGEQLFLRGVLDKVDVTPDFLTCGDYKSAGEMYTNYEPSAESKQMMSWLFDSIYGTCVGQIAEGRNTSSDNVREWIDHGLFSARTALAAGIIDAVEHRADFLKQIEKEHGDSLEFDKQYGKEESDAIDFGNPFAVFKIWGEILQGGASKTSDKDAVGIVYVEGPIMPGSGTRSPLAGVSQIAYSTPIRKALDRVADEDSIKSVVLRVNSPGGSVVASEIILQATRRIAEKKPLVVSMGNIAGSGGYYVACGANTIFADANTITGSIGVVSGKLATKKMWDKTGIAFYPVARGKNAGMLLNGKVFSEEQREKIQTWMDDVYERFKGHVTAIRSDRLRKPIDEIAGGRVYTGKQALELGLVDRLGTFSDAIAFAANEADLGEDYDVRIEPKPKSFIEILLDEGSSDDNQQIRLKSKLSAWHTASLWQSLAPIVGRLEPHRLRALQRAFVQLEILQREGVTLAMPEFANQDF